MCIRDRGCIAGMGTCGVLEGQTLGETCTEHSACDRGICAGLEQVSAVAVMGLQDKCAKGDKAACVYLNKHAGPTEGVCSRLCESDDDCDGDQYCSSDLHATTSAVMVSVRYCQSCAGSRACNNEGHCTRVEGVCKAMSHTDCAHSRACVEERRCAAYKGGCVFPAAQDSECRSRLGPCVRNGACMARDNTCVAVSRDDCKASIACKASGACSLIGDICGVANDEDCREALVCTKHKMCVAREGRCARPASPRQHRLR